MAQNKILLVDDEPLNLDILEIHLTGEGYKVDTAASGTQAWQLLQLHPHRYDAILLDRVMPDMDGIEVLKKAKLDPEIANVPVIMQSAKSARQHVQEGMEAGAYYYLTKPYDKTSLLAIVRSAVEDYRRYSGMQQAIAETAQSLTLMNQGSFCLRTIDEAKALAALLANAVPHPRQVIVGLTEIMLNAVEHGNLAISYDDKSRLVEQGTWLEEIESRLEQPEYRDRRATVTYTRTGDSAVFEIIDEGEGFDWQAYLKPDPSRATDNHGRGIMVALATSFDSVSYQGAGNHVICSLDLRKLQNSEREAA